MQLAVITHPSDRRIGTGLGGLLRPSPPYYQLDAILRAGRWLGLRWFYTDPGQRFRPADAALLHVDTSLIDQDYQDLAARYPVALNGQVADIRKRRISCNLVDRRSSWTGPVLCKSDLNSNGMPEVLLAQRIAHRSGSPAPRATPTDYRLFDSIAAVPDAVWDDPGLVVERYLPEMRGTDSVLRVWNFLGDYERCSWYRSPETIVKGNNITAFGSSEVPDFLREERRRLGFDYGKFDFALGPEGPVLYDTNRTPAYLHARRDLMHAAGQPTARALIRLIEGRTPL